jgi:hypothetical protein
MSMEQIRRWSATGALSFLLSLPALQAALADIVPPRDDRTVCNEQYLPVCAVKRKLAKTYSNECFAHADHAEVIAKGECTGKETKQP